MDHTSHLQSSVQHIGIMKFDPLRRSEEEFVKGVITYYCREKVHFEVLH